MHNTHTYAIQFTLILGMKYFDNNDINNIGKSFTKKNEIIFKIYI